MHIAESWYSKIKIMREFPTAPKKSSLTWAWSLTAVVWLVASPLEWPPFFWIPTTWRIGVAAALTLTILLGPGRLYLIAVVCRRGRKIDFPLRIASAAVLLLILASIIANYHYFFSHRAAIMTPMDLQFANISFIIAFDLMRRQWLNSLAMQLQHNLEDRLRVGRAAIQRIQASADQYPRLVRHLMKQGAWLQAFMAIAAAATLFLWIFTAGQPTQGLVQAATVLIIGAPWLWFFSIPFGLQLAIQVSARQQALVPSPLSFDMATRIDAIVLGKRGTLTRGSPHLTDVIPVQGIDEEELLLWAASAEHGSRHPFGRAVVKEAQDQSIPLEPPERFTEMTGRGVECVIDGQLVRFGKPAFFLQQPIPAYLADRIEALAQEGKTPFVCSRGGGQYLGVLAVTEEIRPEAAAAIDNLRHLHLQTVLVTGDDRRLSETIAEQLHIDQVIAEVLPEDKPKQINKLRREGFHVAMVGIYPEDRASFNESELNIAITRGQGGAIPPTDVVLLEDNLKHIVSFFEISSRVMRAIKQNGIFGLAYHVGMGLIAAGILVPFGYLALSPTVGVLFSGGALLLSILNQRRVAGVAS